MKDAFYISIETLHAPGDGQMENVSGASATLSTGMLWLASVSRQPDTHTCSHHRLDVCQLVRERRMYPSPGPWLHGNSSFLPSLFWKSCFILSWWSISVFLTRPLVGVLTYLGCGTWGSLHIWYTSECGGQQFLLPNLYFYLILLILQAVKIPSTRECYAVHVSRFQLCLSQGYSLQVTSHLYWAVNICTDMYSIQLEKKSLIWCHSPMHN